MRDQSQSDERRRGSMGAVFFGSLLLLCFAYLLASGPVARFAGPPERFLRFGSARDDAPSSNLYITLYGPLERALDHIPPAGRLFNRYVYWWGQWETSNKFGQVRDALQ